ncbi:5,10-methylenetetrahydrofolate reductase [Candidatus Hodgkinia cicadicola]|nr:5,10-methylenetetrahydrofolate reductase [Candidatus Hodgkinia cicadicola]
MYTAIQCLHNLSNVGLKPSAEVLPPSKQDFVSVIGDYSVACGNALPRLVNLTCDAAGAAEHNSYKLLLALSLCAATPRILVHSIQVDKSFKTLWATARSLARLGVSELLFLGGDCSQLGLDLISGGTRCPSLFCETTNYPGTRSLRANALESSQVSQALARPYTQFLDFAEAFAKLSIKSCLLPKLWSAPGFVASVKRLLNCGVSVKCGIRNSASRSILADALTARAMFVCALHSIVSNNGRWLHVNKFRTLRKLVWLLSFPMATQTD